MHFELDSKSGPASFLQSVLLLDELVDAAALLALSFQVQTDVASFSIWADYLNLLKFDDRSHHNRYGIARIASHFAQELFLLLCQDWVMRLRHQRLLDRLFWCLIAILVPTSELLRQLLHLAATLCLLNCSEVDFLFPGRLRHEIVESEHLLLGRCSTTASRSPARSDFIGGWTLRFFFLAGNAGSFNHYYYYL